MSHDRDLLACCAELYGHPLARWLLGDSMHPGGLALTEKLADLLGLADGDRVLDAGSGSGATAVHLARSLGCVVTGVTLESAGAAAGREQSRSHGVAGRVQFLRGDLNALPLRSGSFDAVLLECVLSILPDKEAALRDCHCLLRPGGRLGLTDVTASGPLPPELDSLLAAAGCVGGARPLAEYRQMAAKAGFVVESCQDLPEVARGFLRDVQGRLLMAEVAAALGKLPVNHGALGEAKRLVSAALEAVDRGVLGYGLVTARRP